jgi:hypothetical protein
MLPGGLASEVCKKGKRVSVYTFVLFFEETGIGDFFIC